MGNRYPVAGFGLSPDSAAVDAIATVAIINNIVYNYIREEHRVQGATFKPGKGSHLKVTRAARILFCRCTARNSVPGWWRLSKNNLGSNRRATCDTQLT
jgi:hypothetical protein